MEFPTPRVAPTYALIAALAAVVSIAACTPQYAPPQQTQSTSPSVTYKYHTDQELVQTNQSAAIFCERYRAVPRAASFRSDNDGAKVVAFECVPAATMVVQPAIFTQGMTYSYRTDQELLEGSRNAQVYCQSMGQQQAVANVSMAANGMRTATFQCMPR